MNPSGRDQWQAYLDELDTRMAHARSMGGEDKLSKQHNKGHLDVRQRIQALCDEGSFQEYGALVGGANPIDGSSLPCDALVGGIASICGIPVVILAEDFTVKGGSIGHANNGKRLRLLELARLQQRAVVLMLDGAGERASNALERYPYGPNDLQQLADLHQELPVVAMVMGMSAGHGALTAMFADWVVMTEKSAMFTAGPALVKASQGIDVTPTELGGIDIHTQSGVVHNRARDDQQAITMVRDYMRLQQDAPVTDAPDQTTENDILDEILDILPADLSRSYDVRKLIQCCCDDSSWLELQPEFGRSMVTGLCRFGGKTSLVVANQPAVMAGAITREASEKAEHWLSIAQRRNWPVVFLADNPGVMSGPSAEQSGILKAAGRMYQAQRKLSQTKIHVTLRKAFGFGSSVMAMNGFDHQTLTLAFPNITLGGLPAQSGANASGASDDDRDRLMASQSGAWTPADNGSYDRVIDPRNLRQEICKGLISDTSTKANTCS